MRAPFTHGAIAILLALGCAATAPESGSVTGGSRAQGADDTIPPGKPAYAAEQGSWQVFDLPLKWVEKHWKGPAPARVYVALAPPHPEDIAAGYGTCFTPQRVVLGVVEANRAVREKTAICLHYCAPGDSPEASYRGLWGPSTHLEGITLQVLDDGSIDVIEHYRKRAFVPPDIHENLRVVNKLRYEEGVRIRHDAIRPSDFAFSERTASSCVALEQPK